MVKGSVPAPKTTSLTPTLTKVSLYIQLSAGSGITAPVVLETGAGSGMSAGRAQKEVSLERVTKLLHMTVLLIMVSKLNSVFSNSCPPYPSSINEDLKWDAGDFILAHKAVKASGRFNFEGCKIPIPTRIRHDRIREALGVEVSSKELRVLSLLEFGMPINCDPTFGI